MFDQIFDLVPDAMLLVDDRGRIVAANTQAARLFGHDDGGLVGRDVETLMPAHVRALHRGHRQGYMEHPRVRPMGAAGQTLTGLRNDGSTFPVEIALSPIRIDGVLRYLASIRDISETQRARQSLLRARYDTLAARIGQLALAAPDEAALFAGLPAELGIALGVDAIVLFDAPSGDAAPALRACSGLDADPALRSALPGQLHGPLAQLLAQAEPVVVDDLASLPVQGAPRALHGAGYRSLAMVPLFDQSRPAGALVALARQLRSFDHDTVHCLQSIATTLAALIQRRSAEEQLVHAQRLDAVGQLTGGVAHDFNNMLTVISGNLQLLELEDALPESARDLIGNALRAVGQGAALTGKLLAFSRRQHLEPRPVEPCAVIHDLARLLEHTLGETIRVDVECGRCPPVLADAGQLDAALINLALNARDAMPRGGVIALGAGALEVVADAPSLALAPGRYVVFSVADNGTGMTPEVAARAFEPFFTTKATGKGSGLGLSMVYGFARQSGGLARLETRPGYGTRVELYLPEAPPGATTANDAMPHAGALRGRVLVVEDDARVRAVAVGFLRSLGLDAVEAEDAVAAMQLLADGDPVDVLFTDVVLGPGMDGRELADAARRLHPGLAVILTSGNEQAAGDAGEGDAGYALLRKPYHREGLARMIEQVLGPR